MWWLVGFSVYLAVCFLALIVAGFQVGRALRRLRRRRAERRARAASARAGTVSHEAADQHDG